ncbi:MAG: hypothetical protein HUJ75_00380 [Parasporobacterium sp.]|nr:hypothetical protein [Parasporobacterium sp.]
MNTYPNAKKGLTYIWIAEIATILSAILTSFITSLDSSFTLSFSENIISIVAAVLIFIGCIYARQDSSKYTPAMVFAAFNVILKGIDLGVHTAAYTAIADSLVSIFNILIFIFVVSATTVVLTNAGETRQAKKGKSILVLLIISEVLSIVLSVISVLSILNLNLALGLIVVIIAIAVTVLTIIASIRYLIFLIKSANLLA